MACQYYTLCNHCTQFHDIVGEDVCDIFGVPMGDGSAYCKYFSCNIDECKRSECISQEELYAEVYL